MLDTNAFFNLLKEFQKSKNDASGYSGVVEKLKSEHLCISSITKVEIISVLGKYSRGVQGGLQKCNCYISEGKEVCGNYRYIAPRKKWNKKVVAAWMKLISEIISGTSKYIQVQEIPFSEATISEAQKIVLYALEYNFASMDAMIAATARESSSDKCQYIVVTSDKGLKACLSKCSIPCWDAFSVNPV